MKKIIVYVTGNQGKYQVAKKTFKNTGIKIIQKDIETPEIQNTSVKEIAMYSAEWVSQKINHPVMLTDAGYYIETLNGFPGPFIKYVNGWFSADDFIRLMEGKTNRRILIKDCLAYCEPQKKPVIFTGSYEGTLAINPSNKNGTPMDKIFIPKGFTSTISELSDEIMRNYWSNGEILIQLKKYLLDNHI